MSSDKTKDTGGPAFPAFDHRQGMSLRDYFAAKAMQGLAANGGIAVMKPSDYAINGYLIADAMLKERAK